MGQKRPIIGQKRPTNTNRPGVADVEGGIRGRRGVGPSVKETYHRAKETYHRAKETYHRAKETYYRAKETHEH